MTHLANPLCRSLNAAPNKSPPGFPKWTKIAHLALGKTFGGRGRRMSHLKFFKHYRVGDLLRILRGSQGQILSNLGLTKVRGRWNLLNIGCAKVKCVLGLTQSNLVQFQNFFFSWELAKFVKYWIGTHLSIGLCCPLNNIFWQRRTEESSVLLLL